MDNEDFMLKWTKALSAFGIADTEKNSLNWFNSLTSSTLDPVENDSFIGELHYDLGSNELSIKLKAKDGEDEIAYITSIADLKKAATKVLLRRKDEETD